MRLRIKRDKFKTARSGHSNFLNVCCRDCGTHVLTYQKDGVGRLFRLYMDRINEPETLVDLQSRDLSEIPAIKCISCGKVIAVPYLYKAEQRKAFRICGDSIVKQRLK